MMDKSLNSCLLSISILAIIAARTSNAPAHAFAMPLETDLRWQESRRSLPHVDGNVKRPIIIGYAHDVKSGKAEQAIKDGVSVIIWSFLHLSAGNGATQQTTGSIRTDLDLSAVITLRNKYEQSQM